MKIKNILLVGALILGSYSDAMLIAQETPAFTQGTLVLPNAVPETVAAQQPAAKKQVKEAKSKLAALKKAIKCAYSGKGCTPKERRKIIMYVLATLGAVAVIGAGGLWRYRRAAPEAAALASRAVAAAPAAAMAGGAAAAAAESFRAVARPAAARVPGALAVGLPSVSLGVQSIPGTKNEDVTFQSQFREMVLDPFSLGDIVMADYTRFEDRHAVDHTGGSFGIFDGSAGFVAAEFLKQNLLYAIKGNIAGGMEPPTAIKSAFASVWDGLVALEQDDGALGRFLGKALHDQRSAGEKIHYYLAPMVVNARPVQVEEYERRKLVTKLLTPVTKNKGSQSTAVVAIVGDTTFTIANVGDAGSVLVKESGTEVLTPQEYAEAPEGRRASVGATMDKHDPYIIRHDIKPGDQYLILFSDGVYSQDFSYVSPERMAELVRGAPSIQAAADAITREAQVNGSSDDITVIVIKIPPPKAAVPEAVAAAEGVPAAVAGGDPEEEEEE